MKPTLKDVESLARSAGAILREGYNREHDIQYKGVIDLVTETDHASEEYLLKEIRRDFAGGHILAEESGEIRGSNNDIWYIDPLDGTVNYAHHVPVFCVSIAFANLAAVSHPVRAESPSGRNGRRAAVARGTDGERSGSSSANASPSLSASLLLAAVYDPLRDEMFSAERGKGAHLNGKPIYASKTTELQKSLLVTGFPYDTWNSPRNNFDYFVKLAKLTQGVRRLGSAALDGCYVAAGRFDGFWELSLKPWDVAAAALIAQEAGARVSAMDGNADFLSPPQSVIISAPGIYDQLLKELR